MDERRGGDRIEEKFNRIETIKKETVLIKINRDYKFTENEDTSNKQRQMNVQLLCNDAYLVGART